MFDLTLAAANTPTGQIEDYIDQIEDGSQNVPIK